MTHRFWVWLLLVFVVGASAPARAASPAYAEQAAAHLAAKRPDLALQVLMAVEDQNSHDPAFNYLLGGAAMQAESWGVALNALERLVLQQPNNAGAWLDRAIASYHLGDIYGARQFFDHVEQSFQPPQKVRDVIAGYRLRMKLAESASGFSGELAVFGGRDSNANSGISARSLPLTFGEQRIEFDLDKANWPRPDSLFQMEGSLRYNAPRTAGVQFGALLNGQMRDYATENNFDTRQILVGAGLQGDTPLGRASGWYYQRESRLGGREFLSTRLAAFHIERPWRGCRARGGVEIETRRYATLPALDADVTWLSVAAQCSEDVADQASQWLTVARMGNDRSLNDRPGGGQSRLELLLANQRALRRDLRLEASLHLAHQNDADGYSPLIENGAARRLLRAHGKLVLAHPLTPALEGLIVAEITRQQSNLPLFELSGQMLGLGLRAAF